MKYLVLLLAISHTASAATLGQYISKPEGASFQSFTLSKKEAVYEKHSNFFDKKKSLSLGKFELSGKADIADYSRRLDEILNKVEEVDKFLQKKKSSFNELSSKKPHESFFLLNSYRITKDSDLYPELKKIYDDLYDKDWKQVSGIKLSDDLEKIIVIKNGKEASTSKFNMSFHCEAPSRPTVCGYKELGILYVQ